MKIQCRNCNDFRYCIFEDSFRNQELRNLDWKLSVLRLGGFQRWYEFQTSKILFSCPNILISYYLRFIWLTFKWILAFLKLRVLSSSKPLITDCHTRWLPSRSDSIQGILTQSINLYGSLHRYNEVLRLSLLRKCSRILHQTEDFSLTILMTQSIWYGLNDITLKRWYNIKKMPIIQSVNVGMRQTSC